jgi:hypothetical protein
MEVAMTRTAICHTLSAIAAVALVFAAAGGPASAQARDESDYNGELAILLLSGASPKGLTANGAPEPSTNRQFNRLIVKKLDGVRRAR